MKANWMSDNKNGEYAGQGAKVLLVIEELGSLDRHSQLLRMQGHNVLACDSYDRGMELLGRETFDLIAVSQGTVAFEGKGLVSRALERDRSRPVLVLARFPDMRNYVEAMQLGAVDYLEMPVAPSELTRVLRTHLRYCAAA